MSMTDDPRSDMLASLFASERSEEGTPGPPTDHLSHEDLATLVERPAESPLPRGSREHLSSCDSCREQLADLLRGAAALEHLAALPAPHAAAEGRAIAVGRARGTGAPWTLLGVRPAAALAGAGAALVLAGVALLVPWHSLRDDAAGIPRSGGAASDTASGMRPSGPVPAPGPLVFEWPAVAGTSAYVLVVSDPAEASEIVLEVRTRVNRHVLTEDQSALLAAERPYQWLVRVERGAGRIETGPVTEFILLPDP